MNFIAKDTSISQSIDRELDSTQSEAVASLREQIARMNTAIARAVDSGLTIELTRSCRHHSQHGAWGDQMSPKIARAV